MGETAHRPVEGQSYKLEYWHVQDARRRTLRGTVSEVKEVDGKLRVRVMTNDGPRRVVIDGETAEIETLTTNHSRTLGTAEL